MGKYPTYVILAGILLVLSSGVHVTYTLHRMASLAPNAQFDLLPQYELKAQFLAQPYNQIMPSIYLEVAEANSEVNGIHYSFVFTSGDEILSEGAGRINQGNAGKNTKIRAKGTVLEIERYLPNLKLGDHNKALLVDVKLSGLHHVGKVRTAEVRFYLDPPFFRLSFLGLVVVWTMGILLVLVGAIQWARNVKAPALAVVYTAGSERIRLWVMLCHLSALLGYVFPFGHILGPLGVWMLRREQVPGVEEAGRESLNFQLTVTLMALIGIMLSVVFVGLILLFLVVVFHFSMTLYISIRAQKGDTVTYPLTMHIIKSKR